MLAAATESFLWLGTTWQRVALDLYRGKVADRPSRLAFDRQGTEVRARLYTAHARAQGPYARTEPEALLALEHSAQIDWTPRRFASREEAGLPSWDELVRMSREERRDLLVRARAEQQRRNQ